MSLNHPTTVFIVRIWREPREIVSAKEEWRCMVESVNSHEVSYFLSPEMLTDYIAEKTGYSIPGKRND
jgi:hypothetical protein